MKGLLIKDFRLIMKQKILFILWLGMALFMLIANQDPVFGVNYSLFLMIIMLGGTISYDDFDNGMGFLMTLPIDRKMYAIEKYILIIAGTFVTGLCIAIVSVIYLLVQPGIMSIGEFILTAAILFLISVLFSSIYIPFQLKYGAEKGRIILVIFAGAIIALIFVMREVIEPVLGDFSAIFVMASEITPVILMLGLFLITAIVVGISMRSSIRIVRMEEY